MVHNGHLVHLPVGIVHQPGVLAKLSYFVSNCGGSIIEALHQRLFHNVLPNRPRST